MENTVVHPVFTVVFLSSLGAFCVAASRVVRNSGIRWTETRSSLSCTIASTHGRSVAENSTCSPSGITMGGKHCSVPWIRLSLTGMQAMLGQKILCSVYLPHWSLRILSWMRACQYGPSFRSSSFEYDSSAIPAATVTETVGGNIDPITRSKSTYATNATIMVIFVAAQHGC